MRPRLHDATAQREVLALTRALVALPSVTPSDGPGAGCMGLIAARLAASGFVAQRLDRQGVANLWLRRGSAAPCFVFVGHTDVVPPGPRELWTSDPFTPVERDGYLYGRGTADMKAAIAAFVVAAEQFVAGRPHHAGSIALLLTSDEEGPALDGTNAVVQALRARQEAIDYCLVGEPSCVERLGDTIKNGRRGSLSARLSVRGVQGHVAYPQLARNPIHEVAPVIEELAGTRWDRGDADFPPTGLQISSIHAGTGAGNVIPGGCELEFNLRFAPVSSVPSLQARVERILYRHQIDFAIDWTLGAQAFHCPAGPLLEALHSAIGAELDLRPALSTSGGTSDGRFLAPICRQVAEFGPVNASIHQADERVCVADLEGLSRVYRATLQRLLTP